MKQFHNKARPWLLMIVGLIVVTLISILWLKGVFTLIQWLFWSPYIQVPEISIIKRVWAIFTVIASVIAIVYILSHVFYAGEYDCLKSKKSKLDLSNWPWK